MFAPAAADAWGPEAHRIVARLAAARLSPAARREAAGLLGGRTLPDVSFWADEIRNQRPETYRWHFVDIPRRARTYHPARDCRPTPRGDCIVAAVERERAVLANRTAGARRRGEALMFLVHLIGDLHQPLHCADDHDAGGNDVHVVFLGRPDNLHAVWDSGLLAASRIGETARVRRLEAWIDGRDATLGAGTVVDWVLASHRAAAAHAYVLPADHRLGPAYVAANLPVVDHQLALAGVRLARLLNEVL
jgi:S1/P1 Nuclease